MSEKKKKEPESGSKVSRRNLIGGAATGIVASALAGIIPAKRADASFPPLFCPDSGFTVHNVCGGQNCFSTITIGGGSPQTIGFGGSGTLDKANQNQTTGVFPFRHKVLVSHVPGVGKVLVQLKQGGASTATPATVTIGGNSRFTVNKSVLDQRFTFLDQLDGNGDPISVEPGALSMDLNTAQSSDTSMKFEPDNTFPTGGLSLLGSGANEVKLTGYSMTVNARPKSGDTHLLTITDFNYAEGQLTFTVTKHSSVGAINGLTHVWAHSPEDPGLPVTDLATWTGNNLVSNTVTMQLGAGQTVEQTELRIEVSTPDDTRKLFNFYVHTW